MPVPKRWFPLSRDINDDAEVWELTDKFRGNALRLWMEILALLRKLVPLRAGIVSSRCRFATCSASGARLLVAL